MLNAIINYKDKSAVLEFPMDLYKLYQDLHDIGYQGCPHRMKLTDNEEDDIRVKLYSDNDFGNHLILLLKESDTLEDVHTVVGAITIAPDEVKEQLEEYILHDQLDNKEELYDLLIELKEANAPIGTTFYCPLSGQLNDGEYDDIKNEATGVVEIKEINCLVIISYRVKVLIPEQEVWYDGNSRPSHVLKSMAGAEIDYVISGIDREGECCIASRRVALDIRRRAFKRIGNKLERKMPISILAVGKTRMLASMSGYDITLSQRDLSYAMINDLSERYHTGNKLKSVIKSYDEEADTVVVSVKEAEPHPFDGADARHPVRSRRASSITGKYKGGVFCKLEDNLDCLCTYSQSQYDEDFNIGDEVIIAITKFNYTKKQVYGKIVAKW